MALSDQIERFSKAPLKHKALGLVAITVFFGAIFYFLFYSEMDEKEKTLNGRLTIAKQEEANYLEKERKYLTFRSEVNRLLEEKKELVKVLPTEAEIPTFLQALHAQGELAGLNILTFKPGGEQPAQFYATIPVKMAITGSFHQINKFFYSVGKLKRIVNIKDLTLGKPTETDTGIQLQAVFLASTFRFLAPAPQPAPPAGQGG
jgi:type IV pilus assembly protein PilO